MPPVREHNKNCVLYFYEVRFNSLVISAYGNVMFKPISRETDKPVTFMPHCLASVTVSSARLIPSLLLPLTPLSH